MTCGCIINLFCVLNNNVYYVICNLWWGGVINTCTYAQIVTPRGGTYRI